METGKPELDEKLARLIEEMDKSLHKTEQSLGPNHIVVSKLLDSYAALLKQNNLRPLDALNMEARAKAIRAKNNQKEAEAQSKGLSQLEQKRGITASQIKLGVWIVSGIILIGISLSAVELIRRGGQTLAAAKHAKSRPPEVTEMPVIPGREAPPQPNENTDAAGQNQGTETGSTPTSNQDVVASETTESRDPETGELTQRTTVTSSQNNMTVIQFATEIMKVKSMAKEQLALGLLAEKENDINKATQIYFDVIKVVQDTPITLGRQVCSEEIARCYEGYGRMAELSGHSDIAKQYELAASAIREHISD